MHDKCSYAGCQEEATVILVHPITQLFVETCNRHIRQVKAIMTLGRKKKHTIYEQKSLEKSY